MSKKWINDLIEENVTAIKDDDEMSKEERSYRMNELKTLMGMKAESDKSLFDNSCAVAKIFVEVLGIGAPLVFYNIWMHEGLEFEKEGTFTSQTLKGLITKFKPTGI